MIKKIFMMMLVAGLAAGMLAGCGEQEKQSSEAENKKQLVKKVIVKKGICADAMKKLPKDYKIKVCENDDEIKTEALRGDFAFAVLDAKKAGEMYIETGKSVEVLSPITIDSVKLMQHSYAEKKKRKRIYNPETNKKEWIEEIRLPNANIVRKNNMAVLGRAGATIDMAMRIVLENRKTKLKDDKIEYLDSEKDFRKKMKIYKQFGLAEGEAAAKLMEDRKAVKEVFDISKLWYEDRGYHLPTNVMVISKKYIKNRGIDIEKDFAAIGTAISKTKRPEGVNLVFYRESDRGKNMLQDLYGEEGILEKKMEARFFYND